jgi:7-cyano-7-deazaguanine synthase
VKAILLSGGMDSIALAYWKRPELAFTADYGQAAAPAEIAAARQVCDDLGIGHDVVRVDCSALGSGDMANTKSLAIAPVPEWWPFRNQLLLTLAGMRCISLGVQTLMIGSVKSDGVHADGRPEFYEAIDALMAQQEGTLRVEAPALGMTTVELIEKSEVPRSILAWAHSCHVGPLACGACRGCVKHYEVTKQLYGDPY